MYKVLIALIGISFLDAAQESQKVALSYELVDTSCKPSQWFLSQETTKYLNLRCKDDIFDSGRNKIVPRDRSSYVAQWVLEVSKIVTSHSVDNSIFSCINTSAAARLGVQMALGVIAERIITGDMHIGTTLIGGVVCTVPELWKGYRNYKQQEVLVRKYQNLLSMYRYDLYSDDVDNKITLSCDSSLIQILADSGRHIKHKAELIAVLSLSKKFSSQTILQLQEMKLWKDFRK